MPQPVAIAMLIAISALALGCAEKPSFESPDPTSRLNAIRDAAERNDRSAIPDLIQSLDSDDAAVRLFAIQTLQKLTGETLGYSHAAPEPERDRAVERWVEWYRQQTGDRLDRPVGGQQPDPAPTPDA